MKPLARKTQAAASTAASRRLAAMHPGTYEQARRKAARQVQREAKSTDTPAALRHRTTRTTYLLHRQAHPAEYFALREQALFDLRIDTDYSDGRKGGQVRVVNQVVRVRCPWCGAGQLRPCRDRNGRDTRPPHLARRKRAAEVASQRLAMTQRVV